MTAAKRLDATECGWRPRNLRVGMVVQLTRATAKHGSAYNLTVDGIHTYYVAVGDSPVLVHNTACDDLLGEAARFNPDELAQFAFQHAGEGDLASTPTIGQFRSALDTNGVRLPDQNAVRFREGSTVVIINEDVPWRSTAYISGAG